MAGFKFTSVLLLLLLKYATCHYRHVIHKRLEELKNLSKQMYGELETGDNWQNVDSHGCKVPLDTKLVPNSDTPKLKTLAGGLSTDTQRVVSSCVVTTLTTLTSQSKVSTEYNLYVTGGDKQKLRSLSSLWRDYYDCSVRSLDTLTKYHQMPSMILMVYVGAVARLPCSVCAAPDERRSVKWMFAESLTNLTFTDIQENERMVREGNNLTIYNVKTEDAGGYQCEIGDSHILVVLEIVDAEEKYTVVKPSTSRGPYALPPHTVKNGLILFSNWSPWSECSVCGKVGRRHRYGICYVKLDRRLRRTRISQADNRTDGNILILERNETALLEAFPGGIPCRSRYLPARLRRIHDIQQRPSEIMIGLCKVACEDIVFKYQSADGCTMETANNSAGVYSLEQVLPKQPPIPVRETTFVNFGQRTVIRCPGTTLRDVPVVWRSGNEIMVPREIDEASDGRMYINSRDHIVITKVLYRDANLYSCWQRNKLCGTVKLVVSGGVVTPWSQHAVLGVLVLCGAVLLRLVETGWHTMKKNTNIHRVENR